MIPTRRRPDDIPCRSELLASAARRRPRAPLPRTAQRSVTRRVQLGGRWTDGTGSTENALFVDGRLHKVSEELRWEYDTADFLRPWRVHGETLDLTFVPFYDKITRTNLGIVSSHTDQCFGWWSGQFTTVEGDAIGFEGILGWAEDVRNRW